MRPRFIICMGVSGSGKSSVGKAISNSLGWDFYDADDFHSPENIAKMTKGEPLDDLDRASWLTSLHDLISSCLQSNRPGVLACSALKKSYRNRLTSGNDGVQLIYLRGDYELIMSRLAERSDHYMKPELLKSQFEILEEPQDALVVDVSRTVDEILRVVLPYLE